MLCPFQMTDGDKMLIHLECIYVIILFLKVRFYNSSETEMKAKELRISEKRKGNKQSSMVELLMCSHADSKEAQCIIHLKPPSIIAHMLLPLPIVGIQITVTFTHICLVRTNI